jgi:hypothetical protein
MVFYKNLSELYSGNDLAPKSTMDFENIALIKLKEFRDKAITIKGDDSPSELQAKEMQDWEKWKSKLEMLFS